jgi:hypothetical protein
MSEAEWKHFIDEEAVRQLVGDDIYEEIKDMSDEERRDFFDKMAEEQMKEEELEKGERREVVPPTFDEPEEPLFC